MKIFISHSSKNVAYGNALVNLLTGVGIRDNEIIFTSNDAYGIPIGESIFNWLKNQISEKPHVIYLLSPDYYSSIACLNEMGAAWIIENEHTIIFTPNFDINSREFQSGALDPREIGFYINNEDRLFSFIDSLGKSFNVSTNVVLRNQKIKDFLKSIALTQAKPIQKVDILPNISKQEDIIEKKDAKDVSAKIPIIETSISAKKETINDTIYHRFLSDIRLKKLKDNELLLIHYIMETARFKLGTGWQEGSEITKIENWEDINGLNSTLSRSYGATLSRFQLRKYIEIAEYTSSGNPRLMIVATEIQENLLDFPQDILNEIDDAVKRNPKDLPF